MNYDVRIAVGFCMVWLHFQKVYCKSGPLLGQYIAPEPEGLMSCFSAFVEHLMNRTTLCSAKIWILPVSPTKILQMSPSKFCLLLHPAQQAMHLETDDSIGPQAMHGVEGQ